MTVSTGVNSWWIFGLVFHRYDGLGWLKPTILYICIFIRIVTLWVPVSVVMNPTKWIWDHSAYKVYEMIPAKLHKPLAALVTIAVFLIGSMVPEETGDNTRANRAVSLFGLVVMIAVLTITSRDWRKIPWHTVIGGMLTQFIIAVFVLRTQAGYDIFNFISFLARTLLSFAEDGVAFLTTEDVAGLTWFLISVVPPIIFFVALVQLLYHVGLLQWFIGKFAAFFFWYVHFLSDAYLSTQSFTSGLGEPFRIGRSSGSRELTTPNSPTKESFFSMQFPILFYSCFSFH